MSSPSVKRTPREFLANLQQRRGSYGFSSSLPSAAAGAGAGAGTDENSDAAAAQSPSADDLESELLSQLEASASPVDWLNAALARSDAAPASDDAEAPAGASLQALERELQRVSTFAARSTSEAQHQTDELMRRLRATVPQLKFDLKLLRESALALKESVQQVEQVSHAATSRNGAQPQLADAVEPASSPLERLSRLTLLKERMSAARDVLRDAESWSSLEADVTAYLSEDKLAEASLRLAEAHSSLTVFERTEVYDQRAALMQALTARLEAAVQAPLQRAVEARDLKASAKLGEVLARVERGHVFERCWMQTRRRAVFADWAAARLAGGGAESESAQDAAAAPSLADYLPRLHASLQTVLNEERIYAPVLFPSAPGAYIARFLAAAVRELDPPMAQRLAEMARAQGPRALDAALRCWDATQAFALAAQRLIAKMPPPPTPAPAPAAAKGHAPQESRSGEASLQTTPLALAPASASPSGAAPSALGARTTPSAEKVPQVEESLRAEEWDVALYEPFLELQCDFRRLSSSQVLAKWRTEAEAWSSLRDSGGSGGIGASSAAAHSIEAPELLQLGSSVFDLLEESVDACLRLTKGFGGAALVESADEVLASVLSSFEERARLHNAGISIENTQLERDVKLAARLLAACRQLFAKIQDAEARMADALAPTARFLVNPSAEAGARLLQNSTLGALQLLQQSALNSPALSKTLAALSQVQQRGPARSLLDTAGDGRDGAVLCGARAQLLQLVCTVQATMTTVILQPLLAQMLVYASLPCWTARSLPGAPENEYELHMPSFSLSPTETMASLGEGLLDLPRLFEVYAQDDAFAFCVRALPYLQLPQKPAPQQQPQSASTPEPAQPDASAASRRSSFHPSSPTAERRMSMHGRRYSQIGGAPSLSPGAAAGAGGAADGGGDTSPGLARRASAFGGGSDDAAAGGAGEPGAASASETLSYWLRSLVLTFATRFVREALGRLPSRLSQPGAKQLASDLEYLCSILDVLNIDVGGSSGGGAVGSDSDAPAAAPEGSHAESASASAAAELANWRDAALLSDDEGRAIAAGATLSLTKDGSREVDRSRLRASRAFAVVAQLRGFGRVV